MAAFKKLNLDHSKIANTIQTFPNVTTVQPGKPNYKIQCDGKEVTLGIWLLADGTTTINPDMGQNQVLGTSIAEYIIEQCKTSDAKAVTYSLKTLKDGDFEFIIKYLEEAIPDLEIDVSAIPTGQKYVLRNTLYKDTFTLIKHSNGTIQLQGKPLSIYSELYAVITELVSADEIISINNDTYKVSLIKADIYAELESMLPVSYEKLCDTSKKILMSSIALRKIELELDDYSPFSMGALRGLEAFMKLIILKKYRIIKDFGDIFEEEEKGFRFVAKSEFADHVQSSDTIKVMENSYNFYKQNRHSTFHASNVPATSSVIDLKEANRIIETVCQLIEEGSNEI